MVFFRNTWGDEGPAAQMRSSLTLSRRTSRSDNNSLAIVGFCFHVAARKLNPRYSATKVAWPQTTKSTQLTATTAQRLMVTVDSQPHAREMYHYYIHRYSPRDYFTTKSYHATGLPSPSTALLIIREVQGHGRREKGGRLTNSLISNERVLALA